MTKHSVPTEEQLKLTIEELQSRLLFVQEKTAVCPYGKVAIVGEYHVTEDWIYLIDLSGYPVYKAPRYIKATDAEIDTKETKSFTLLGLIKWPERVGYGPLYRFYGDVMKDQGWEIVEQIRYVRNKECFPNVISRHSVPYKKRFFAWHAFQYRHKETGFILGSDGYRKAEPEASDIRYKRLSFKTLQERGYDAKKSAVIHQAWSDLREAVTVKSENYMKQLRTAASFRSEYGELLKRQGWQIEVEHAVRSKTGKSVIIISLGYNGRTMTFQKENFIPKLLDSMGYLTRRNEEKTEEISAELEQLIRELYTELNEWI